MRFGGLRAVDDVTFDLNKGEILGIIGPNGAGKTTLLRAISGVYRHTSGNIIYDGKKIDSLQPHERCKLGIALTNQVPQPFKRLTVLQNLLVAANYCGGLHGTSAMEHSERVLDITGLSQKKHSMAGDLGI
mgnify:CR=1 FL=1